ncbi:GNAT family N-acetyltransferase [Iodobacter sp. HSC-16F04]|uniref:GNAT family N-acetyltransferase n=1 Tax=Iodobacter violaceini TaxID=3044271 RepID=A0ABX0KU59_9NEIS|nr:GNAT family N-acetyltransferase [Iodobacter violacea]NHQ87396.1 GNAT family N-acetyltransferase [Iodobacter violacea]
MTILTTARLRLEAISDHHFDGLFKMNSQPEVMRYITGKPETPTETRAMIERVKARWTEYGFSWWSFIETDSDEIIGAGCIQHLGRDPANPLEIGWRLRKDKWGLGYASEAAQAMAAFAFDKLEADSLYAVCHQDNHGSAHVMKKLGMQYRGTEHWYEMDTAVWSMDKAAWRAKE